MEWLYDSSPKPDPCWSRLEALLTAIPGHGTYPRKTGTCGHPHWCRVCTALALKLRKCALSARRTGTGWWSRRVGTQAPSSPALWPGESEVLSLGLSFLICQMAGAVIIPTFHGFSKDAMRWHMSSSSDWAWHVVCTLQGLTLTITGLKGLELMPQQGSSKGESVSGHFHLLCHPHSCLTASSLHLQRQPRQGESSHCHLSASPSPASLVHLQGPWW